MHTRYKSRSVWSLPRNTQQHDGSMKKNVIHELHIRTSAITLITAAAGKTSIIKHTTMPFTRSESDKNTSAHTHACSLQE